MDAGWLNVLAFLVAFVGMEGVAFLTHKYVMHGWLWSLHASHHDPARRGLEKNDWFVVFFASPSVVLIYVGSEGVPWALWAGIGVAAYGFVYFLFHDVLVHRRIGHGFNPKRGYLRRVVHAHRLHHATETKDGAVSFGFVYARPALELRAEMKALAEKRATMEPV